MANTVHLLIFEKLQKFALKVKQSNPGLWHNLLDISLHEPSTG